MLFVGFEVLSHNPLSQLSPVAWGMVQARVSQRCFFERLEVDSRVLGFGNGAWSSVFFFFFHVLLRC